MNLFMNLIIWINCVGTTDSKVRITLIIVTGRFIYWFFFSSFILPYGCWRYSFGKKYYNLNKYL